MMRRYFVDVLLFLAALPQPDFRRQIRNSEFKTYDLTCCFTWRDFACQAVALMLLTLKGRLLAIKKYLNIGFSFRNRFLRHLKRHTVEKYRKKKFTFLICGLLIQPVVTTKHTLPEPSGLSHGTLEIHADNTAKTETGDSGDFLARGKRYLFHLLLCLQL